MEAVQIIGGRAGQVFPHIIPLMGEQYAKGKHVIFLVPQQYTLQAERELVERLRLPGMIDLEVLSPQRLYRQVHEKAGSDHLQPLDDRGQQMAISQVLTQVRDQLTFYAHVVEQPGLPSRIAALMNDMKKAGMVPADLADHAKMVSSHATQAKEGDLAIIWQAYEELIEGRFADAVSQQQDVNARLLDSGVMQGACVYVYGFDVLPQPFMALLVTASRVCEQMVVTFTMDKSTPQRPVYDERIFATQRASAEELKEQFDAAGIPVKTTYISSVDDGRDGALRHLEKWLFSRKAVAFEGDPSAVQIHALANPYAEAAYAAQTLCRWHDEGIAWDKMAVAFADSSQLPGIVSATLRAAGIPYYLSEKDSAIRHGLCRMLIGSVRAACNRYQLVDVMLAAKSGFSPLTIEEAMLLENYALEHGFNNQKKWTSPLVEDNEQIEALRQKLIIPIQALQTGLRNAKNAVQSVEALFALLTSCDCYQKLLKREEELLAAGMQAEAAQNRQIWQLVMGLLDQIYALLGEKRAAMGDLARIVESGLVSAAISSLPPSPNTVMMGEAGHLMTGHLDALLLMGLQDGTLSSGTDSLITEDERIALTKSARAAVGLTRQEQTALRQQDIYRTIALPTKRLTITFAESAQDGAAMAPSGLIADACRLLPGVHVGGGVKDDGLGEKPLSPMMALESLSLQLRQLADGHRETLSPEWQAALNWLWHDPAWQDQTRAMVDSLFARVEASPLTKEQVRVLFGQSNVSITQLQELASCPYRHLVDYGFRPVPRREYAFQADERGTFYHDVLSAYTLQAENLADWPKVDDALIERMLDDITEKYTKAWEGGPLRDDAIGASLGEEYIRNVRRAAWTFTKHARNSLFTPYATELRFGFGGDSLPPVILKLSNGREVALRGIIDRVDRYESDHGVYLRVVDYKSSDQSLDPIRMYYGIQLQLLLYLQAMEQGYPGGGTLPAGAFYSTIKDPLVESKTDEPDEVEKLLAKELRLSGVVLADVEVVEAMDVSGEGLPLGKVLNKDKSFAENALAFTLEEMHALLAYTQKTATALAEKLQEGDHEISPAKIGTWDACSYCSYRSICGQDPALPGGEMRELDTTEKKELWASMSNKEGK